MTFVEACIAEDRSEALRAWIVEKAPRGSETDFEITIATPKGCISLASGDAERDRKRPLGCLQDAMLACFATALADAGTISLEASVEPFLPELSSRAKSKGEMLFSHLLTHCSGVWIGSLNNSLKSELRTWRDLCAYLNVAGLRFKPGSVATYSLLERLFLIKALERALDSNPYDIMRRDMLGADSGMEVRLGNGVFSGCGEIHARLTDFLDFFRRSQSTSWFRRLNSGEYDKALVIHPVGKAWAPRSTSLGMFQLGNGVWGQDGGHPVEGFIGFRTSRNGDTMVLGRFHSPFEREEILGRICADVMCLPLETHRQLMGHLNGFQLDEIEGEYEGWFGSNLRIEATGDLCIIKSGGDNTNGIHLKVGEDGELRARWGMQNMWVEPQNLGEGSDLAIRIGQDIFIKKQ